MKLQDLKTGQRVRFRNGDLCLVLRDVETLCYGHQDIFFALFDCGWVPGISYNEDMTNQDDRDFDIMSVHNCENGERKNGYERILDKRYISDPIWERKEQKEMTISEIEQELGYKIKIVGGAET